MVTVVVYDTSLVVNRSFYSSKNAFSIELNLVVNQASPVWGDSRSVKDNRHCNSLSC